MKYGATVHAMFVAAAVVAGAVLAPSAVFAQQDSGWLWGGGQTHGGSGREVVRFSPQHAPGQVIVSFGDRRLYLVTRPGEALSYPIAIPREQSRWQGVTSVSQKRENPSWTPTPTMIAENPRLPRWVPGGHPLNPLGVRALYLGSSTYRIHGTDAPWTIGAAVSKGCIRMYNQDVVDLYPRVPVGSKVIVTWSTFRAGGGLAQQSAPLPPQAMMEQQRAPAAVPLRKNARRVAAVEAAPSQTVTDASPPVASVSEDDRPRRSYAPGKKIVAKKVTPKLTSVEKPD